MARKIMKKILQPFWATALAAGLVTVACSSGQPAVTFPTPTLPLARIGLLTPFSTATPSPTVPITTSAPPPSLPTLTPTPRTHEVKKGEDMFGLALRYGITLEELLAANPNVKPNFLSVGALLVIPASSQPASTQEETTQLPSPTPIALAAGIPKCSRSKEGGAWCFMSVQNDQIFPLEGVTAIFRPGDQNAEGILPQYAALPLDILAPGDSLPLAVYFPPPVPEHFRVSVEILSALSNPDDGRYLRVRLDNQKILLADNGLSAEVETEVSLDSADASAQRIWVVAVAYDDQGSVVGVRRWEHENGTPLQSGQRLQTRFAIYSVIGKIERVELHAQARP